jgi:hypothetical protein
MLHKAGAFALGIWLVLATGCGLMRLTEGDLLGRRADFYDAQKHYTQSVRWGDLDKAAEFVDPKQRESFQSSARLLADVHFSDWENQRVEVAPDDKSATAIVIYHAYLERALTEISYREKQSWSYDETTHTWVVTPGLADLPRVLGKVGP